ncbi:MAG: AAA family ATPase [Polyangiales bacterium]
MIKNFKAWRTEAGLDFDVSFDPARRFHCLVGVNGVGKTHLIEHLARTLLTQHSMLTTTPNTPRFAGVLFREEVDRELAPLRLRLATNVAIDGDFLVYRGESPLDCSLGMVAPRFVTRRITDRPVVFVGARERGHTPNVGANQLKLLGDRTERFVRAFKKTWRAATGELVTVEEPAEWFASRLLINPAFVSGNDNDFEAVVETLRLLQQLEPREFAGLVVERPGGPPQVGLTYQNGALLFGGRPIDKLATGYIAVLKIFQEIVAGYSGWAAMLPEGGAPPLRELDGVVFIDEVEAHLHPQWQARIVDILKRSFPNTTFFVTTHSPLVVRQTEPGEAVEILRDGDRVTSRSLGSPRDWYLADLYAEGFHVELPLPGRDAPGGARPLGDVMLDFSGAVREFTVARDAAVRAKALGIHDEIDARLAPEDPRRRSLSMLRELLG